MPSSLPKRRQRTPQHDRFAMNSILPSSMSFTWPRKMPSRHGPVMAQMARIVAVWRCKLPLPLRRSATWFCTCASSARTTGAAWSSRVWSVLGAGCWTNWHLETSTPTWRSERSWRFAMSTVSWLCWVGDYRDGWFSQWDIHQNPPEISRNGETHENIMGIIHGYPWHICFFWGSGGPATLQGIEALKNRLGAYMYPIRDRPGRPGRKTLNRLKKAKQLMTRRLANQLRQGREHKIIHRTQKKLNFRRWLVRPYDEVKGFEKNKELGKYVDPLNLP